MASVIEWDPVDCKHYKSDASAWLCVWMDRDRTIDRILLREGTHHYFESLDTYDLEGNLVDQTALDGPGPHEFSVRHLREHVVFVRVRFLPYQLHPASPDEKHGTEKMHRVDCGTIFHDNAAEQPIVMRVHDFVANARWPETPPHAVDVFRARMPVSVEQGPMELVLREDGAVQLHYLQFQEVEILFLRDEHLPPTFRTGETIGRRAIPSTITSLTIPPRELRPLRGEPPVEWFFAVPLARTGDSEWMVGVPLARMPLIDDLQITPAGCILRASWRWLTPVPDIQVRLTWQVYTEEGYEGDCWTKDVPRFGGRRFEMAEIFEQTPEDSGKALEVTAVPIFLGRQISIHAIDRRIRLLRWHQN
jgi:hypothetical protein